MDKHISKDQTLIEGYLKGDLKGDELDTFTLRLMRDKNLQETLQINRIIFKSLWKNSQAKSSAHYLRWILGGLTFCLILLLSWKLFLSSPNTAGTNEQNPPVVIPADSLNQDSVRPPENLPTNEPEQSPNIPAQEPRPNEQSAPATSRPIAANFEVNPLLESYLSTSRGSGFELELPQSAAVFKFQNKDTEFRLKGTLAAGEEQQAFTFLVFSNKLADYENFLPLHRQEIQAESQAFDHRTTISLEPGLFYFILEDSDGQLLHAGKFTVE